jgi:signal transduction histidine kinase
MSSPAPDDPARVSREEFEEFLQALSHDLRNRLNAIALEAADLAERAGDRADDRRLQQRIRDCALFLKTVRDSVSPEEPDAERLPLAEIIAKLRARDLRPGS